MQPSLSPLHMTRVVTAAFPARLADDVQSVLAVVPDAGFRSVGTFDLEVEEVEVQGEMVAIPRRLSHEEPAADAERVLTETQRVLLHCLYSRHHDGRVRQRRLEQIVASSEPWAVPFVVQLAGEYVLEILEAIRRGIPDLAVPGSPRRRRYGEFLARNPAFFARTERRVVSYWACNYRWEYPFFGAYPGCLLLEDFRASAAEQTGTPWPRHTPPPLTGAGEGFG